MGCAAPVNNDTSTIMGRLRRSQSSELSVDVIVSRDTDPTRCCGNGGYLNPGTDADSRTDDHKALSDRADWLAYHSWARGDPADHVAAQRGPGS